MQNTKTQKVIAATIFIAGSHEAMLTENKAQYLILACEVMKGVN
jgi:hypothetical protein